MSKKFMTKHIAMNPSRCVACWKCVEQCPKGAIGKVGFMWHHHAVFSNADACTGCRRCVKTCQKGVFFVPDADFKMPGLRQRMASKLNVGHLLSVAFVVTAVTGVGLHLAWHAAGHATWHSWAVAHVAASLLWIIAVAQHVGRHWRWYTSPRDGSVTRIAATAALSAAFLLAAVTGLVLLAFIDGGGSGVGLWHYWLGILLAVLSICHVITQKRR